MLFAGAVGDVAVGLARGDVLHHVPQFVYMKGVRTGIVWGLGAGIG
jgi:hypothetical protein